MRTLRTTIGLCSLLVLHVSTAYAGGSIPLTDVMDQLKDNAKLIAEINAELAKQKLTADAVTCSGARFGGQWTEISGARAVPFDCAIGERKLHIDGTVHFYDQDSAEIDANDEKAPERTFDYKQTDLAWTWDD
jgi:hypothetical protein